MSFFTSVIFSQLGTAMEALSGMVRFLRSRPTTFASEEVCSSCCPSQSLLILVPRQEAIRWSIRAGQLHNAESARVSMPAQLKLVEAAAAPPPASLSDSFAEEEQVGDGFQVPSQPPAAAPTASRVYTWRVNLEPTSKFFWLD